MYVDILLVRIPQNSCDTLRQESVSRSWKSYPKRAIGGLPPHYWVLTYNSKMFFVMGPPRPATVRQKMSLGGEMLARAVQRCFKNSKAGDYYFLHHYSRSHRSTCTLHQLRRVATKANYRDETTRTKTLAWHSCWTGCATHNVPTSAVNNRRRRASKRCGEEPRRFSRTSGRQTNSFCLEVLASRKSHPKQRLVRSVGPNTTPAQNLIILKGFTHNRWGSIASPPGPRTACLVPVC